MNEEPLNAGLDFGTTTSVLSYFEDGELQCFQYGDRSQFSTEYVPTVVAYKDDDLVIGPAADDLSLLPGSFEQYQQYRYFKMLLPQDDRAKWSPEYGPYASSERTPAQITADFIGHLIYGDSSGRTRTLLNLRNRPKSFYERKQRRLDGLVVSVPQVWRDWQARGRQQLQSVVSELNINLIQLISEPVAAAAFFAHKYKIHGEPYEGNLLVCDMGGGTFDVALCKLGNGLVQVLCNYGDGKSGLGRAGAHFDYELLKQVCGDSCEPALMADLMVRLDRAKKDHDSTQRLELYLNKSAEERVDPIYHVTSYRSNRMQTFDFLFDDVREAFAPVHEGIHHVLKTIQAEATRGGHGIDKVILVGGFSKFPLVQKAITEFFGEDFDQHELVDLDSVTSEDMAFAISYGACLIANGKVTVSEQYEHAISVALLNSSRPDELEEVELIPAGKSLDALADASYCRRPDGRERRIIINQPQVQVKLTIARYGNADRRESRTAILTELPGAHIPDNRWYLGARVDSSKIPYLVIKDKHEQPREYSIGDLLSS